MNEPLAKARERFWNMPSAKVTGVSFAALAIGSFFFAGLSPLASGTVGSAVAALLYYLIPALQTNSILLVVCIITFVAGTAASSIILRQTGEKDPGIIVIDEVVGQWTALITFWYAGNLIFIVAAFLFFRVFDVLKIYPASLFERRHGGAAVMLDDIVAGVYANIAAHLAVYSYYQFIA